MAKLRDGTRVNIRVFHKADNTAPGNLPEGQKYPDGKLFDELFKPCLTGQDFLSSRFVFWGGTVANICDGTFAEDKSIFEACGLSLVCKSGFE